MIQKQRGSATVWVVVIIVLAILAIWWMKSNSTPTPSTQPVATPTPATPIPEAAAPASPSYLSTLTMTNGSSYLADVNGRTLYTKVSDKKNTSTCTGACLSVWPAYVAQSALEYAPANYNDLSTMKRDDSTYQYTWKGMPLYYYAKDQKTGDTTGDGFNKAWNVAKP
ncbi:MAG: hypothetical protein HY225_03230 [Candidatus Vogelbacteria bacterium]|nr:hypothetical protein [Candidatus Vogelbacteria bacterium]